MRAVFNKKKFDTSDLSCSRIYICCIISLGDLYLARQRHYNDKEPICESERTDLRYVITIGKRSARRHGRMITESTCVYLSANDDFKENSVHFVRHWTRPDLQLSLPPHVNFHTHVKLDSDRAASFSQSALFSSKNTQPGN